MRFLLIHFNSLFEVRFLEKICILLSSSFLDEVSFEMDGL